MEKYRLQEFVIPVKNVEKKVIYHFSDSHFTEWDNDSSEAEREEAIKNTENWEKTRSWFCKVSGEGYGELQQQPPMEHFNNLLNLSATGDALVMAGDILDYISGGNLRTLDKALKGFEKPFLSVCGNHEVSAEIPEGFIFSCVKNEIQVLSLGDMIIVGIDNSKRTISRAQIDFIKEKINEGLPILIVMHIPIMTDENHEKLSNSGEYFQLNYDGCPAENIEFVNLLKDNSDKFIAVLAGHLHYSNTSVIANSLTQYVTGQGITGNINKYIIGE